MRLRILLGILAATLSGAYLSAAAQQPGAWPLAEVMPFSAPQLLRDERPDLCAKLLEFETQTFLENKDPVFPTWIAFVPWEQTYRTENRPDLTALASFHGGNLGFLDADIDNDGDIDTLIDRHQWKQAIWQRIDYHLFDATTLDQSDSETALLGWLSSDGPDGLTAIHIRPDEPLNAAMPWRTNSVTGDLGRIAVFEHENQTLLYSHLLLNDGASATAILSLDPTHTVSTLCLVKTGLEDDKVAELAGIPELQAMQHLMDTLTTETDQNAWYRCRSRYAGGGTIRNLIEQRTEAAMRPWRLDTFVNDTNFQATIVHLIQWGEQSRNNWLQLALIDDAMANAIPALAEHYRDTFPISDSMALDWARSVIRHLIASQYSWDAYLSIPASMDPELLDLEEAQSVANIATLSLANLLETVWSEPLDARTREGLLLNALVLRGDPHGEAAKLASGLINFNAGIEPALHYAVGQPDMVKLLLNASAPIDNVNPFGKSALMYAAQYADIQSARILLDAGAKPNLLTWPLQACDYNVEQVRTALDYAIQSGSQEMIDLLREHGAMTSEELGAENAVQH